MFNIVSGQKLYEQIVEQIKNQIAQEVFKKGDMLPSEKELMEQTGVSRVTIREALRILSEAGVIETRQGKGSFVLLSGSELGQKKDDSLLDYRKCFENTTHARLILEPEAAKYAAVAATKEDIEKIERCLTLKHTKDKNKKTILNEDFHRTIFDITRNPYLIEFFEHLVDVETHPPITTLIPPHRQKSILEKLERQHQKIFNAIQEHDGEFAYFYMKEHTLFIKQVYEDYFNYFY